MKALIAQNGDVELRDLPDPDPVLDQVLVKVVSAGINRADLLQISGGYPAPPGWPADIPGLEYSGRVMAVGAEVMDLSPGDEVFGIVGGGAFASHLLTRADLCVPIPQGLDIVEAGGVPEAFITGHDALVTQGNLRSGERVLVHAVASGVGTAVVQLARVLGANTVGTSRTREKLVRVEELGLDEPVVAGDNMAQEIGEVDLVIDLVGGDYVKLDTEVCRTTGRIVLVGLMAGATADIDLSAVLRKRLTLKGTVLRARPHHEKVEVTRRFANEVVPLFERKLLRPLIEETFPLSRAKDAFELVRSNRTVGKVLLKADE